MTRYGRATESVPPTLNGASGESRLVRLKRCPKRTRRSPHGVRAIFAEIWCRCMRVEVSMTVRGVQRSQVFLDASSGSSERS